MARTSRTTERLLLALLAAVAVPIVAGLVVLLCSTPPSASAAQQPAAARTDPLAADDVRAVPQLVALRNGSIHIAMPRPAPRAIRSGRIESDVDAFAAAFPDELPGAARVVRHLSPASTRCLIHIRQMHYVSPSRLVSRGSDPTASSASSIRSALRDVYGRVNRVQRSIVRILTFLSAEYSLRDVYTEGLDASLAGQDCVAPLYRLIRASVYDACGLAPAGRYETGDLRERDARYVPGAAKLLAMEGKIRLLAGEHAALTRRARRLLRRASGDPDAAAGYRAVIFDAREDWVLRQVAGGLGRIAVVVYGGAHSWQTDIRTWNRGHANVSLIEITPEGYS